MIELSAPDYVGIRMNAYTMGFNDGIHTGRNEVANKIRACLEHEPTNWRGIKRILEEYDEDANKVSGSLGRRDG